MDNFVFGLDMVREAGVNEKGRLMMRLNKGDIKAAVDRNILVYDSKAKVGVLTKALSTYMSNGPKK